MPSDGARSERLRRRVEDRSHEIAAIKGDMKDGIPIPEPVNREQRRLEKRVGRIPRPGNFRSVEEAEQWMVLEEARQELEQRRAQQARTPGDQMMGWTRTPAGQMMGWTQPQINSAMLNGLVSMQGDLKVQLHTANMTAQSFAAQVHS